MAKEKKKKTERNNQWASTSSTDNSVDFKDKTATDNEWVSTNKKSEPTN